MSAASAFAFQGLTAARKRLQRIADGLRAAAGGKAVELAAGQLQTLVDKVAFESYAKHRATGALAAQAKVIASGGLVQLQRPAYAHFHVWDKFRRGMPPFILKRAAQIFAAALLACIRSDPGLVKLAGAAGIAEAEAAEAEGAAADQKVAAKQLAAGERKAARATARAEKAAERREARAHASTGKKIERMRARHVAKMERNRARGAARSAQHEARMGKLRDKSAAREEARLNKSRAAYRKANAKIARSQARAAKRGQK